MLHLAPGGPLSQFALVPGMTQAELAHIGHEMGLDRPLPVQYWEWFTRLLSGDWGHSYPRQPAGAVRSSDRICPATLELMLAAIAIAVLIGIWVGVLGAVRRYSLFDYLATVGAMVALSIPTFWFGLVAIYIFSVKLGWLPAGNRSTIGDGSLRRLSAPPDRACVGAGAGQVAIWSRYMRSSMLEVINQDYIRTARAKGLPERTVLLRHAFRNALLPMITSPVCNCLRCSAARWSPRRCSPGPAWAGFSWIGWAIATIRS